MQIFDYLNKDGLLHLIRKIMGRDVDLTQAEYDALPESKNSDGKNYYIYDSDITVTAEEVGFDGSASGSTAANSQQALDELFAADKKMNESLENLNSNLIISETSTQVLMTANRELDDTTEAITIPSGYKPITMYAYNSQNNDNVSAVPLLIRSDGRILYHAKNHSASDQGTIHFVIRVTFKRM